MRGIGLVPVAVPLRHPARGLEVQHQRRQVLDGAFELGQVYVLSLPRPLPVLQCRQYGRGPIGGIYEIAVGPVRRQGLPVRPTRQVVETRVRRRLHPEPRKGRLRAGLPLLAGAEQDDVILQFPEAFVVQPPSLLDRWRIALGDHVRLPLPYQPPYHGLGLGPGHVQAQPVLARVVGRRKLAGVDPRYPVLARRRAPQVVPPGH